MFIKTSFSEWSVMVFPQHISERKQHFYKSTETISCVPLRNIPIPAGPVQWTVTKPLSCVPEPPEELWLGLNDLRAHFYFEWSDGTPVTFTAWQRGQPTYMNGLEDCVTMRGQVQRALPAQNAN